MANLKEIKNRISSVVATQQITKAMKMVAAAKLRKSQDRVTQVRPFAKKLSEMFYAISRTVVQQQNWYSEVREDNNILIIAINSDRGLCGSFNMNVAKATVERIQSCYQPQHDKNNVTILPLGKKAYEYFSKGAYKLEDSHWDLLSRLSFSTVSEVALFVIEAFKSKRYDKVEIIYNEFKNVATQILKTDPYLPLLPPASQQETSPETDYICQPDKEKLIATIAPKVLKTQLFKALLNSMAAENGARMTAMDKATENAGELLKELRLTYNRTRQAMITKEISEIVGGAEALKNN